MQRCTKIHLHGSNDWSLARKDTSCKLQSVKQWFLCSLWSNRPRPWWRYFKPPFQGLDENLIKCLSNPSFRPLPSLSVCTPCPNSASGFWEPNIRLLRRNWISRWKLFQTKGMFTYRNPIESIFIIICLKLFTQKKIVYPIGDVCRGSCRKHPPNIFGSRYYDEHFLQEPLPAIFCTHHLVCTIIMKG